MFQHAPDEELHVPLWRVQTNMRVGSRAHALEGLGVQRCAQSMQTSYLGNYLSGLDKCVDSEQRRMRRKHEFVLSRSGFSMKLLHFDAHFLECEDYFAEEGELQPLFRCKGTPGVGFSQG